jgi:hypothetical protein
LIAEIGQGMDQLGVSGSLADFSGVVVQQQVMVTEADKNNHCSYRGRYAANVVTGKIWSLIDVSSTLFILCFLLEGYSLPILTAYLFWNISHWYFPFYLIKRTSKQVERGMRSLKSVIFTSQMVQRIECDHDRSRRRATTANLRYEVLYQISFQNVRHKVFQGIFSRRFKRGEFQSLAQKDKIHDVL